MADINAMTSLESMLSPEMLEHIDLCAWQIWYWRRHLDVFIQEYLHIKLFDLQQVIARAIGNGDYIMLALLRGSGKTWLLAVCATALAILWPESPIISVSNTAEQANLLLKKIEDELLPNADLAREIDYGTGKGIKINTNGKSRVSFKDGSNIRTAVLGHGGNSALGLRGKIMIVDEAKLIPDSIVNKVLRPILSYKRRVYYAMEKRGFVDYPSKIINISSAYFKTCDYYGRFKIGVRRMALGDTRSFACALDFKTTIRWGIEDEDFYERAKEDMSSVEFACEYGTIFVGASDNSVFPYSLTEPCRVLSSVEISQPKGSTSQYIISTDVAGDGDAESADNSSISVIKLIERSNGRLHKHLVWMGTYRGITQRQLAEEIRKAYLRFPNTIRVVYDANAIGRGIKSLLDEPYSYEDGSGNKKELPPIVPFDSLVSYRSLKILYPFIGTNDINSQMVSVVLRNFEDQEFLLPVPSIESKTASVKARLSDDGDSEEETKEKRRRTMLMTEEAYIYREVDELQAELGNIVRRMTAQGRPIYGTAISTQRKDRFSSVGMAMYNIDAIEEAMKKDFYSKNVGSSIPIFVGNL